MAKILILITALLSGCTAPAILGVGAASAGVEATTGRSPVDLAASYSTDKDCRTLRVLNNETICQNRPLKNTGVNAAEAAFAQRRGY